MRQALKLVLEKPWFERAVLLLIGVNAITLGLETSVYAMENWGGFLKWLDSIILFLFVAEIGGEKCFDDPKYHG